MDFMQSIQDLLGNGDLLAKLSQSVGADSAQVGKATQLGIPALLQGLNKNAQDEAGARSLADALDYHATKQEPDLSNFDIGSLDTVDGSKILGHIFGNQNTAVADSLSARSGLSAGQTGGLLSMLAPLLMNLLGKEKQSKGIDAGGLSDLTGTLTKQLGGGGGLLSGITGMLDKDKDGSVIDDLKDMFGGLFGGKD